MPGAGLGNALLRSKKRKAEQSQTKYREAVLAAKTLNAQLVANPPRKEAPSLTSIWQTSNMDEFLSIAEHREHGFQAERNVQVVVDGAKHVVLQDKLVPLRDSSRDWYALSEKLPIPKRPEWTFEMSAEEIQSNEQQMFVAWRRSLSTVEETERLVITPYEKNLEVWRQLWRVVERSDVVLEIVDARNPLAFRSADFEQWVVSQTNKEKQPKLLVLLLNKADLLTDQQRQAWATYLLSKDLKFVFFSAAKNPVRDLHGAQKAGDPRPQDQSSTRSVEGSDTPSSTESQLDDEDDSDDAGEEADGRPKEKRTRAKRRKGTLRGNPVHVANVFAAKKEELQAKLEKQAAPKVRPVQPLTEQEIERDARMQRWAESRGQDLCNVLSPEELLDFLASLRAQVGIRDPNQPLMAGLVGYPNVGKSSTINAIIGCKKVVVSATPGKTKHFQTLAIPEERRVMLCDCPGLVFPSLASNCEAMICDGILPIATVKDYVSPVKLVAQRIPKSVFERLFKVTVDPALDVDDSTNSADLLLNFVARRRGYMTEHDKPNRSRAAKEILQMYVDGDIVFVHPPPGFKPSVDPEHPQSSADPHEGEEDDEEDWEDISSAEDARALSAKSDDGEDDGQAAAEALRERSKFLSRSRKTVDLTPAEVFNAESNSYLQEVRTEKTSKSKKVNPQLEADPSVFINEEGKKELVIDSDDGIVTLEGGPVIQREKRLSKRQVRRTAKREQKSVTGARKLPGL